MPKEYNACVESEMKSGKSKEDAQRICAISYIKRHGISPKKAENANLWEMPLNELMNLLFSNETPTEAS